MKWRTSMVTCYGETRALCLVEVWFNFDSMLAISIVKRLRWQILTLHFQKWPFDWSQFSKRYNCPQFLLFCQRICSDSLFKHSPSLGLFSVWTEQYEHFHLFGAVTCVNRNFYSSNSKFEQKLHHLKFLWTPNNSLQDNKKHSCPSTRHLGLILKCLLNANVKKCPTQRHFSANKLGTFWASFLWFFWSFHWTNTGFAYPSNFQW